MQDILALLKELDVETIPAHHARTIYAAPPADRAAAIQQQLIEKLGAAAHIHRMDMPGKPVLVIEVQQPAAKKKTAAKTKNKEPRTKKQ
jgi:hypothetical protein